MEIAPQETIFRPDALSQPSSLRHRVTEVLREAMVAGELAPGQVYSAPALAKQLNVSPTPVREAMMELANEGLVETLRHRGYRIVEFEDAKLEHIRQLREFLEVPAVGKVAELARSEDVLALRTVADELEGAARSGEFGAFIAADMTFHLELLKLMGNPMLVEEVRRLRGLTRLYGLRQLHETRRAALIATAHEHHELLDVVDAHDVHGAEELMRHHLGHVRGLWAGKK